MRYISTLKKELISVVTYRLQSFNPIRLYKVKVGHIKPYSHKIKHTHSTGVLTPAGVEY